MQLAGRLQYGDDGECIALLRKNPAFVNHELRCYTNLPWSITVAAEYGKTKAIQYLVAQGADITASDAYGYTALHTAAREGHVETAAYLLKQGLGVNLVKKTHAPLYEPGQVLPGEYGPSPLTAAAQGKSTEMITFLIKAGANVNGTPPEPLNSPLHAALDAYNKDSLQELLNSGADPTLVDQNGKSVVDYAIELLGKSDPCLLSFIQEAAADWKKKHGNAAGSSPAPGRKR